MAAPGLMFVVSRVRDPQKISDILYNCFYGEEHLAAVLAGGHVKIGLRYKNANANSGIPYIALYPVDNASTIGPPESLKHMEETKKSIILECDDIFDLVHLELGPYEKIETYEEHDHKDKSNLPRCRIMICVAPEPAEGRDEDVESWYREEPLHMLSMGKGFRRCTRYKRKDDVCPRFMALAEYDCAPEDLPMEQIREARATEWSEKILNEAKAHDCEVFVLIQAQGDMDLTL